MLLQQTQAELALVLGVSEGAASRVVEHAKTLVRDLPESLLMDASCCAPPASTRPALTRSSGNCWTGPGAAGFRGKARRLRERQRPGTIPARTRPAFKDRRLGWGRSTDGMSWPGLYGPARPWKQQHFTGQAEAEAQDTPAIQKKRPDFPQVAGSMSAGLHRIAP